MEKMKLNSEIGTNRSRVINGHGPHKILEMIQEEMLERLAKKAVQEKR